jgi:phosphotransacetylase
VKFIENRPFDDIAVGDTVDLHGRVVSKDAARKFVTLDCGGAGPATARTAAGRLSGTSPAGQLATALRGDAPSGGQAARFQALIAAAAGLPPARTAVVHPCDTLSLTGALEAAGRGMILPVLVGPRAKIEAAAQEAGVNLDGIEVVEAPHSHAAAERAIELVREGKAEVLMKGKLHTDELMAPAVDPDRGLRTERRMSHVFALDVPSYSKLLFITDAAINIFPDLETKRDIVQNAIDLAQALGIALPKVALLSAVETVYPKIPSTIEAAALCKMLDRGQITGGLLDGPLAIDNAISREAAEAKGICSEVAGDADILMVPDLEAGNMIAKQLVYLASAQAAGIVLGARVPIILTSRADGVLARLASTAMARIHAAHRRAPGR